MEISSLPYLKPTSISKTTFLSFNSPSQTIKSIPIFPQNHFPTLKTDSFSKITITHSLTSSQNRKTASFFKITPTPSLNSHKNPFLIQKRAFKLQLSVALIATLYTQFPCFAAETILSTEQTTNKIDLESILVSIDGFFNRNPFFVSGVTFIWLVVIPLTQEYLKKYKFISANDAFEKLRKDPNSQLLDIREKKSLLYLGSPNLTILNKKTVQVQFLEREEEGFVKKVLQNFKDPGNTTICIVDNFDGNSMKVAELLFKNGFKEAYATRGGLRGKEGWQAIQETLLPSSVHVFPKKGATSKQLERKDGTNNPTDDNGQAPSVSANKSEGVENGYTNTKGPSPQPTRGSTQYLSPYPNVCPDIFPPCSSMCFVQNDSYAEVSMHMACIQI